MRRRGKVGAPPPREQAALDVFNELEAKEAAEAEAQQRAGREAAGAEHRRRQERRRRDQLACADPEVVRFLASLGELTPDEVREWAEARAERRRRVAALAGLCFGAMLRGCAARIVEGPEGEVAVAVNPSGGASTFQSGYAHPERFRG